MEEQKQQKEKKRVLNLKSVLIILFLLVGAVIISLFLFHKIASNLFFPEEYRAVVKKYSHQYDLDPLFVSAVIYTESHYDPSVVSHKGAVGLMQLLPSTASSVSKRKKADFQLDELKDPETNIKMGCMYLRHLLDKYEGDLSTALAAYNAGSRNVNKWMKASKDENFEVTLQRQGFDETKSYVENVQKIYRNLTRLNLINPL